MFDKINETDNVVISVLLGQLTAKTHAAMLDAYPDIRGQEMKEMYYLYLQYLIMSEAPER